MKGVKKSSFSFENHSHPVPGIITTCLVIHFMSKERIISSLHWVFCLF